MHNKIKTKKIMFTNNTYEFFIQKKTKKHETSEKKTTKNIQQFIYIHTYICDNENDAEHFLLNNK